MNRTRFISTFIPDRLLGTPLDKAKIDMTKIPIILSLALLSACGGGGGGSAPTSQATASISASKKVVMQGESTVISWGSSNASSCTASGYWSGNKAISGSQTIALTGYGDQSFTVTCGTASSTVSVQVNTENSEGSCVNPHKADIYESYLGVYEIPMPQNSFSDDHVKAVGFKDYGVEWIYGNYKRQGASWVADCSLDQYTKLMYRMTLRRLKEHGVTTALIYNFGYWKDSQAELWQIDHTTKHIDDEVINYIVSEAEKLGIDIHYVWQFLPVDRGNEPLFPFNGYVSVDMPLLKKIMDAHEHHILWEADRLESINVGAISADWSAMWLCWHCGVNNEDHSQVQIDALKDYYMERMGSIIDQIKKRFSGKVHVGEGIQWNDKRVFDKVDGISLPFGNLLLDGEVDSATVDLMQERATAWIEKTYNEWHCLDNQPCWYNSSSTIPPVIFNLFSQSHGLFLSKGWVEDGFCTQGTIDDVTYGCVQYEIKTDFSAQAIFTEGLFRAIDTQSFFDTLGTTTSTGYWLSDTLIPDANQYPAGTNTVEGFPNISQSIRGKPAEKLFKYWYTGEYEPYEPAIKQ